MPDCIFCKIVSKEIPASTVWENERFLTILDVQPINPGHLLIIPKQHVDVIYDLPADLYQEVFEIAKQLSVPLQKAMQPKRIGMSVEGFGVPHAHVHLIPINAVGELNPERARTVDQEELKQIAEKIKQEIK